MNEDTLDRIADALESIASAISDNAQATQNVAAMLDMHDCGGLQNSQVDKIAEALSSIGE